MMSRPLPLAALAVLLGLLAPVQAATLALDGDGGDAWTFRKPIHGRVLEGSCDAVLLASPLGDIKAKLDGQRFAAEVTLVDGLNRLRATCWRNGIADGTSPPQDWVERLRDGPKAWANVRIDGGEIVLDAAASERAHGRTEPLSRYEWRARPGNPAPLFAAAGAMPLEAGAAFGPKLVLRAPRVDGSYYVQLRVSDALGRTDESTAVFHIVDGRPRIVDLAREHPPWVDSAVIYGAVPQLFGPRGLPDVTARLDAIAALGATVLWLSPITNSPAGDFGYAVTDHFHLRRSLGSDADLRALVKAAHARGLKVILDVAANHLSDQHPYYRDAARRGPYSAYATFFARDGAGKVTHYFDWTNLENLDFDNPEVRHYAIEAFARWVRDFDVDGFRVDAAWAIRQRAPDFWPQWRAELKRIKPDLLLLAEASARDPYYGANGFDAAYDWTEKLGEWAWHDAFAGPATAARLRAALASEGSGVLTFRFLDNNDTGQRFITGHGERLTRLALAMIFTLPGLPGLYMGEEVGAAFEPYVDRKPIVWTGAADLREDIERLAALRRETPALRSTRLIPVATSADRDVLAYLRPGAVPEQSLLVLLNYSHEPIAVDFADAKQVAPVLGGGRGMDVLTHEAITVDPDRPSVLVPGLSARVLQRPAAR
jgi:cyclomaltodextrinase